MDALQGSISFVAVANKLLDFVFLWGGLFLILQYPFRFFAKGMDKYDKEQQKNPTGNRVQGLLRELFSQSSILLLFIIVAGIAWVMPELVAYRWPTFAGMLPLSVGTWFRWFIVCFVATLFIYIYGHENGEGRWLTSCVGHTALIFFGLVLDGWMGVIFISLPVLVAYYSVLYRLALVIMPTARPDDPEEKKKRAIVFIAYTWGLQFPMSVADEHAWEKVETRIPGDFTWDYPVPGLVWTPAHQVVGITGGTKFKRVAGPGLVFTGQLERADQVFDLRLQLRTNAIDVVTRDGISLKVVVFTAFRIDNETWSDELYKKLRTENPLLRGAQNPDHNTGSFHFSHARVRATIAMTSSKAGEANSTLYWDQWALNIIEDQTRKVIAQKKLDELWRLPEEVDTKFGNALDEIAKEIKSLSEPILRARGILLYVSRVVNFNFPAEKDQMDEISKQQIAIWSSERENRKTDIEAQARAEVKSAQHRARAYAASLMLKAIEEGLKSTHEIGLNPHITAMLFSALQEYIDKPLEDEKTPDEHHVIEPQEPLFPHKDKEKK